MMEAVRPSETSVSLYQAAWCNTKKAAIFIVVVTTNLNFFPSILLCPHATEYKTEVSLMSAKWFVELEFRINRVLRGHQGEENASNYRFELIKEEYFS